jgi:hypothetical protein
MNVTNQDKVLSERTTIEHGQQAVWTVAINDQKPQPGRKQGIRKQMKEVIAGARRNVLLREAQTMEELIADYQDVFELKGGDYEYT